MKLQSLTIIFIIIILPIVLVLSAYIGYEIKTINKQNMYNTGLQTATHDAIFAFEMNTRKDSYSNNAENKRSNIKASIKTFENSLSTACNLGLYDNEIIEEYIPAIVFGLYDGFYMYAPSELTDEGENSTYKHNLRNYVYYSERIKEDNIDIVINYTLDNYIAVSGTIDGKYVTKAGYLLIHYGTHAGGSGSVNQVDFDIKSHDGSNWAKDVYGVLNYNSVIPSEEYELYCNEAYRFYLWFGKYISDKLQSYSYLQLNKTNNDPEDPNSPFNQHKKQVIKQKIEEVLNSSITAYAKRTGINYKMPKFLEEDWEKIYNNISVISLVQGMNLGFKNYNNYCILNSTNSNEYVNPNLIYFTDGNGEYHDIRCKKLEEATTITGYKIGDFEKQTKEVTNADGTTKKEYYYSHDETACYECINGSVETTKSVYDYVRDSGTDENIRRAYFTALAKERYNTTKLLSHYNDR